MVARMTLSQIAAYLQVEALEAKNAMNRIGICAPSGDDESILITSTDLKRTAENIAVFRQGWATSSGMHDEHHV
jgi:hypothetical protein